MKTILLGTSALVGIAAAGPAFAQATPGGEPIKLGLFGHFLGAYGAITSTFLQSMIIGSFIPAQPATS